MEYDDLTYNEPYVSDEYSRRKEGRGWPTHPSGSVADVFDIINRRFEAKINEEIRIRRERMDKIDNA